MAEEVAAQPDVAEAQAETSSEPIKYDESLLIIVKGKVQAPKQPDHAEAQILVKKLQAEISKRADRIKEIKGIEENLRGKAQGVAAGNPEVIKKLQGLRNDRGAILRTKAATREELRSTDATREALRAEMRSIRDKSRNVNPDKLEEEISQLEYRVQHESLSEQEEKKVHQQIQNLTAARPLARKFQEYDARLKETEAQRGAIVKRLQELDAQVKVLDDAIAEQNAILDEAKAKADQHKEDLPALQVEKKENYEICVALRAKIDELRKKNDEEYQDFIKRDRAFKAYQREQRRLKYLERVKEREARDKERAEMTQAAAAEAGVEPFQAEVLTCDHMLGYLRGLAGVKEEEAKQEEKKIEVPAGLKPLKREEQLDDIFKGLGKKAKPQKGKAAPAPAAKASESKPKVTKLNFTLETLKTFMALGVDVPQTSDQLLATIDKVEAKKASYLERRAKAKEAGANGHARVVEEEPAPSTSAAAADEEPAAAAEADEPAPAAVEEEEEEEEAPAPAPAADKPTAEEPAAAAEKPAPAAASATPAKVQEEQAEEEADSEPVSPAPAADAAAEEAANGLGVKLKVSGETVSLSITA